MHLATRCWILFKLCFSLLFLTLLWPGGRGAASLLGSKTNLESLLGEVLLVLLEEVEVLAPYMVSTDATVGAASLLLGEDKSPSPLTSSDTNTDGGVEVPHYY